MIQNVKLQMFQDDIKGLTLNNLTDPKVVAPLSMASGSTSAWKSERILSLGSRGCKKIGCTKIDKYWVQKLRNMRYAGEGQAAWRK